MRCGKCGADNSAEAKFCYHCGNQLPEMDRPQNNEKAEERKAEKKGAQVGAPMNPGERNDTVCPFCKASDCQPMQKSSAEVKTQGYRWGSGCCGMFLLGPFGLLCGLCGTGSKTKVDSELWWTCTKCGKQHIALKETMRKWENTVSALPVTGVSFGIASIIFKLILNWTVPWLFGTGLISSTICFLMPIICSAGCVFVGLEAVKEELSQELGEPLDRYLTKEQMETEKVRLLIAILIALAISLFGIPALNLILGE